MKGNAKRTAFGDVSNIIASKRISKDDFNVISKVSQVPTKGGQTLNERKSAANLLRPAQRPLSVSNLKNFLTGSNTEIVTKVPLNDSVNIQQQAHPRKVLSKRNTTIFKDVSLNTVQEDDIAETLQPSQITIPSELPSIPSLAEIDVTELSSNLQLPPPISTDTVDPIKLLPPSDISLPGIQEVNIHESRLSHETEESHAKTITEDTYIPSVQPLLEDEQASKTQYVDALPVLPEEIVIASAIKHSDPMSYQNVPRSLQHIYQPTPEPEEYWEEEYDEAYDEDGYVTAKSFRSRGDNTTGGATTMLEPLFSKKILHEIEDAAQHVEANRTIEDVEDEGFDTSMVAEYGDEIFQYMREQETRMMPNPHYMNNQHEIQWSMRAVLMDWLVQVHHRFNLLPETLFLCVNYVDRFLSCKVVSLGKLQLVGATAIFIAAKYEEINCPSVQEIVYMVDGGYSVDEILKAERFMLTMLQFELGFPGPMSFLRRISKADDYDLETRTLAKYFLEVTLMDEKFLACPPSFAAAASHYLAQQMLRKGEWSKAHVYYSGYVVSQLKPVAQAILECCEDPRKHHQAVFNKYCDKRYKRASAFVETELQRGFCLPGTFVSRPTFQPPYQPYFAVETYA